MIDNALGVGIRGDKVVIVWSKSVMSQAEAINMAAWIVALTDKEEFERVLEDVMRT